MRLSTPLDLKTADARAILLLLLSGFAAMACTLFNATLIYDDAYLPGNFSAYVDALGWFHALIKVFCLDLPTEYRTYGLSRSIQFIIWSLHCASPKVYVSIISLAQIASSVVLYRTLLALAVDRVAALCVGLVWILSPFAWTSCFHHYSYLILPAQIAIGAAWFIVTHSGAPLARLTACLLGLALGLTGELHLVPTVLMLFLVAHACAKRAALGLAALTTICMLGAVTLHYAIWKAFAAEPQARHRFTFTLHHDSSWWSYRFSAAIGGIWRSAELQTATILEGIRPAFWLGALAAGAATGVCFWWVSKGSASGPTTGSDRFRSWSRVVIALIFLSVAYLAVYVLVVVLADSISSEMPRRYGYVPLTMALAALVVFCGWVSRAPLVVAGLAFGLVGVLFIRMQAAVLPATRAADNRISAAIAAELQKDNGSGILLFNASGGDLEHATLNGESPGPAMRPTINAEVTQAQYGTFWPAATQMTRVLGATFVCELQRVRADGAVKAICPDWFAPPTPAELSRAVVVANLGSSKFDPLGAQVHVFHYARAFLPYYFSTRIIVDGAVAPVGRFNAAIIDLGETARSSTKGEGTLADKHFGDERPSEAPAWLINYGWIHGDDLVYRYPDESIESDYYRTNRHGSFEYELTFDESDVELYLDCWEQWGRAPGQRIFEVQVSWNGAEFASLGNIDLAALNRGKPLSIRLTALQVRSFRFRLSPVAGTIDVPVIQGVRIFRVGPSHPAP